jgi:hypothetical protein
MHTSSQPQTLGSGIKDNGNFLISYYGLRGKEVFFPTSLTVLVQKMDEVV